MKAGLLLRQISEQFPEVKWKSYRFLTHGWDHDVVILDGKTIFRTAKDSRYRNELENEIGLLHYLKKKVKVGIPEYDYVSEDRTLAGYRLLEGWELTPFRFKQLNSPEREIVARQLAGFITSMHATPKFIVRKFHVKSSNQQELYEELTRTTRKLVFPRLSKKDTQLIESYFTQLEKTLHHNFRNVLVHNDLTDEHILWDAKNKQVNVIDFSDRTFGDPAVDFAGILEYGSNFTKHVFDLYRGKKDELLLERARLYFKRVSLYMMKDSLQGFPCRFGQGYKMFAKRFGVQHMRRNDESDRLPNRQLVA